MVPQQFNTILVGVCIHGSSLDADVFSTFQLRSHVPYGFTISTPG